MARKRSEENEPEAPFDLDDGEGDEVGDAAGEIEGRGRGKRKRATHAITDLDTLQQRVGDEVVELLVESGDIGNDPRYQTLRTEVREGHAPTAAMNCSRRLRCSRSCAACAAS